MPRLRGHASTLILSKKRAKSKTKRFPLRKKKKGDKADKNENTQEGVRGSTRE